MSFEDGMNFIMKEYPWPKTPQGDRTMTNPEIEKIMAEVKDKIANWIISASVVGGKTLIPKEHVDFATEKILSLPIPIGEGVCKECGGEGHFTDGGIFAVSCDVCNGTGKVVKTITVEQAIRDRLNETLLSR